MKLDKIFSIKLTDKTSVSLAKALLIYYIMVGNNFTGDLYSGQLRDFIKTNRYAQHFVGLLTMLVLIVNFGGVKNIRDVVYYTIFGYMWFVLSTKMDLKWSLSIISLLVLGYLYEVGMEYKESRIVTDGALEETDRKKVRRRNRRIRTLITASIIVITAIGMFQYLSRKTVQYGGEFDPIKFVINDRN